MTTAISIRLPKLLADQIDNIAKETERPRSFIIQKALESLHRRLRGSPGGIGPAP